jgi:hypothetical protein
MIPSALVLENTICQGIIAVKNIVNNADRLSLNIILAMKKTGINKRHPSKAVMNLDPSSVNPKIYVPRDWIYIGRTGG